jgi:hypothetical protein
LSVRTSKFQLRMISLLMDTVLKEFSLTRPMVWWRWRIWLTFHQVVFNLFTWETHGDRARAFGTVHSQMRMRLGMTIRVSRSVLITHSSWMVTSGSVLKTGRPTITESTFARFSQVRGLNSPFHASGKATLPVARSQSRTQGRNKKKARRPCLIWTRMTAGLIILSLDWALRSAPRLSSAWCRKIQKSARDLLSRWIT